MNNQPAFSSKDGRRSTARRSAGLPIILRYRNGSTDEPFLKGSTVSIDDYGLSCRMTSPIPKSARSISLEIQSEDRIFRHTGRIVWLNSVENVCGIQLQNIDTGWNEFILQRGDNRYPSLPDRRKGSRRTNIATVNYERRQQERRFDELLKDLDNAQLDIEGPKVKTFLRSKSTTYTSETIQERREWLSQLTQTPFKHLAYFSEDVGEFKGKVENPIGIAHVPLGVAGPLKINGEHAKGVFFIPLATTEGALVTSYTLGSHIVTRSGGANVHVLKNELRVAPMFVFKTLQQAKVFIKWLDGNFKQLKEVAEQTSNHLRLRQLSTVMNGRRVIVNFHYDTGDAMGMNMACNATEAVCQRIRHIVRPEEFWLRSNYNANKKATANNFINGYGKTVTADVTIPRKLIGLLDATPEQMERYFFRTLLSDTHAGMIGANGHFANAVAAIYIACGQDVACVANAHVGISTCEVTKAGDLYFSAYLSNLLLGTVGGGTGFGTAKECLQIMGCYGAGKALKFAEIVAATALAGEISICASVVNGTYVLAHEMFGRNRLNP